MNLTPLIDWFAGEEGLALWNIERAEILAALAAPAVERSLLIGPAASNDDPLGNLVYGQSWYFDPAAVKGNPWLSDNVSSLPVQDECIDLVILRHCMTADEKSRHLLFDVYRVLKPGGRIVLSCLNSRGWLARGKLRGHKPPALTGGWIRTASHQAGLSVDEVRSLGFGGLSNRFAGRQLPAVVAGLSNLLVCTLSKPPAGGEIRRLVYRLPERGRSVAASTGVYSKTGT
jgi:SAM-dependent methyltransferase